MRKYCSKLIRQQDFEMDANREKDVWECIILMKVRGIEVLWIGTWCSKIEVYIGKNAFRNPLCSKSFSSIRCVDNFIGPRMCALECTLKTVLRVPLVGFCHSLPDFRMRWKIIPSLGFCHISAVSEIWRSF